MEHELKGHMKKIYHNARNRKKSWKSRLAEILVEIFIIVFAVTLSISLHSWSEKRHQQEEVREFLSDIRASLESLDNKADYRAQAYNIYAFAANLTAEKVDSLNRKCNGFCMLLPNTVMTWDDTDATYESFKSSGKLGYIKNKEIKREILWYYQTHLPSYRQLENETVRRNEKLMDYLYQNAEKDNSIYLNNRYVKTQLMMLYTISKITIAEVKKREQHLKKLKSLIDKELQK